MTFVSAINFRLFRHLSLVHLDPLNPGALSTLTVNSDLGGYLNCEESSATTLPCWCHLEVLGQATD